MLKRIVALFAAICFSLVFLVANIATVSVGKRSQVAGVKNTIALTIDEKRGAFYDRNMSYLTDNETEYVAIIKPSEKTIAEVYEAFDKATADSIIEKLKKGYPVLQVLDKPVDSTENIKVITRTVRYSENQILSHIIGYYNKNVSSTFGLEKSYDPYINISGERKVNYHVDAMGRLLSGDKGTISDENYNSKIGVVLSIDKRIQKICEKYADEAKWFDKGAIVVLDVKTSEILASVSRPNLNLKDMSENLNDANSPFVNRAFTAYTVGSVFKPVVAAAALEENIKDHKVNCVGYYTLGNKKIKCHKESGHGIVNMEQAIAQSCNPFFISLSQNMDGEKILDMANKMGFGKATEFADDVVSDAGNLPTKTELLSKGELANFSFGQGSLLATPLQIANMIACIANDGVYNQATLIKSLVDENGNISSSVEKSKGQRVISSETAKTLMKYLKSTVDNGTGKSAKPKNLSAAGKTSTAQTGTMKSDSTELLNAWFAGVYPYENPKYAIVVMKEDGKSGSSDCCPIFKNIVNDLYYLT